MVYKKSMGNHPPLVVPILRLGPFEKIKLFGYIVIAALRKRVASDNSPYNQIAALYRTEAAECDHRIFRTARSKAATTRQPF